MRQSCQIGQLENSFYRKMVKNKKIVRNQSKNFQTFFPIFLQKNFEFLKFLIPKMAPKTQVNISFFGLN